MGITSSSSKLLSHPDKLLRTHLSNVSDRCRETVENLHVDLSRVGLTRSDLADICWILGICHDFGKATSFFQEYLNEKDEGKKAHLKNKPETNHAHLSSLFTYKQLKTRFTESESPVSQLIPLMGYEIVRRHHGNLENLSSELLGRGAAENHVELSVFKKQIKSINTENLINLYLGIFPQDEIHDFIINIDQIYEEIRKSCRVLRRTRRYGLDASIICLFCFSVLICMDKEDASGLIPSRKPEELQFDLIDKYRNILGYDKPDTALNKIRNSIYLRAQEKAENINLDNRIISLNMPTGSGKTLTGLNFALRLRERIKREKKVDTRIIYSVSFISIIDQNSRVFEEAYETVNKIPPKSNIMLKHHHLADVLYDSTENESDYDLNDSLFMIEGWNSEIIFTTFIQFFHSILTNRNRALRKLHRVVNSIVLLDEVQSIPHEYWLLLRDYLKTFSEFFQTYFIFMTATMPYIFSDKEISKIIDDPTQYYGFFDRVDLHPRLEELNITDYLTEVVERVKKAPDKRYLLVHNTVKCSQEVYRNLREQLPEANLVYLSTMVTPKERLKRIKTIRGNREPAIVVSTQLIEAGVDIDVDTVYRDLAPIDSIIQASGRCNRNFNKKKGDVFLVKLMDKKPFFSYIYSITSILITRTIKVLNEALFPEAGFKHLVDRYYTEVEQGMSNDKARKVLEFIQEMKFEELKVFKLIENDYPKIDVFIEDSLEAADIWEKYKAIKEIKNWKERRTCFLGIKQDFLEHIISVPEAYIKIVGWSALTGVGYVSLKEGLYDEELGFIRDDSI